jgi:hypothetical protein
MEVHHHSGEHHGPKKFKDYFLEFLMIFLAVTMGFLAENVREYLTDDKHVTELAGQLKEDLINDTLKLQYNIEFEKVQIRRGDSLFEMLKQPPGRIDLKKLQDLIVDCIRLDYFYPSRGAISTIQKELQLKKFVKTKIAMHIDNYERDIGMLEKFENGSTDFMTKYLEGFVSLHFTPGNSALAISRLPVANGNLRNLSDADLVQLSVDVQLIKAYNLRLLGQLEKIKIEATNFILHINKTYNLED